MAVTTFRQSRYTPLACLTYLPGANGDGAARGARGYTLSEAPDLAGPPRIRAAERNSSRIATRPSSPRSFAGHDGRRSPQSSPPKTSRGHSDRINHDHFIDQSAPGAATLVCDNSWNSCPTPGTFRHCRAIRLGAIHGDSGERGACRFELCTVWRHTGRRHCDRRNILRQFCILGRQAWLQPQTSATRSGPEI